MANNERTTTTTTTLTTISFEDFTDVQTRLVLLPRIEEEGVGAVVASYFVTTTPPSRSEDDDAAQQEEKGLLLQGSVLIGLGKACSNNDDADVAWKDQEFSSILASIREADTPIVLRFEAPTTGKQQVDDEEEEEQNTDKCLPEKEKDKFAQEEEPVLPKEYVVEASKIIHNQNDVDLLEEKKEQERSEDDLFVEEKKVENDDSSPPGNISPTSTSTSSTADDGAPEDYSTAHEDEEDEDQDNDDEFATPRRCESPTRPPSHSNNNTLTNSLLSGVNLSSWTKRVSDAATNAAAMARAAANERSAAAATVNKKTTVETENGQEKEQQQIMQSSMVKQKYSIFVQSQTGAFLDLAAGDSCGGGAGEQPLTNASLLVVRVSPQEPAEDDNNTFQWYRWSSATSWEPLSGATRAAFQPSATEVGYRLRCVVTTNTSDDDDDSASSAATTTVVCETTQTVTAALSLFNGARQALVRGAQFAGLIGRGKAAGRTFRVQIEISSSSFDDNTVSAAVTLYQVAGNTAECMHENENPIVNVTAAADPGHAKNLELIFRRNPDGMVAALCQDGNRFQLQAPNRLARESLLLAIGIANYKGKPVDLDAGTILYKHDDADDDQNEDIMLSGDNDERSDQSNDATPANNSHHHHPARPSLSVCATSPQRHHHRSASVDSPLSKADGIRSNAEQQALRELEMLRSKLTRKDKIISELQRQVTSSDESLRNSHRKLASKEADLKQCQANNDKLQQSLLAAEKKGEQKEETLQRVREQQDIKVGTLESEIHVQGERIAALEKANRTLANEKDVLSAAVEARESKLAKMAELQASFDTVSSQVAQQKEYQKEVDDANKRCSEAREEVARITASKSEVEKELKKSHTQIESLNQQLKLEVAKTASHKSELEKEKMKIQKLKAERNSYKQKGDSLAKEMSRVCRHGRTVREVEKVLADDVTRRQEVELLREQKRKALEQVEHYRTAYEQSLEVQKMAGLDHDSGRLLERNAELERLLSEMTEYVSAKEMQLETMKQVNDALQSEIRDLAKASMSKNDI